MTAVAAALAIGGFAAVMQLLVRAFGQHADTVEETVVGQGRAVDHATGRLLAGLADLGHQVGQTVTYQTIKALSALASSDDDPVTRACRAAHREILVLDVIDDSGDHPASSIEDPVLAGFLDMLITRVTADRDLAYHRIVQMRRPEALGSAKPVFEAHCAAMVELWDAGRRNVTLKTADLRYPFKFILVDGTHLMLQLNAANRDRHQRLDAFCEFLFVQAHPELIRGFREMWDDVAHHRGTHPVTALPQ
ncbi:hypothetical protein GCM10009687_46490 [Asanoa iriomotensis]|uniref:Uncharacterized protein n=2 Tax=Asanoa iriomotensis TaxID=234613 RepID=A0ABQ4BXS7_9ACTN|nr:hypothetical protein Air01nite_14070 [Asanoa iriomotensis]